ncbi:unnamed protein product [Spirodela intermedia]|uniref:Strictosidine synthase conserved region domain-containing protein n=1 Tax=Spirodela intermedia TaxID=51605 RepID=A0A7I8IYP1_SPIIN|nr:unnamed protein product [Spirodela intermedia]CAA6662832.1 unnamed protein product [Spirodela intermedia]
MGSGGVTRRALFSAMFLALALYCGLDPLKQGPMVEFPGFETYKVDLCPWEDLPPERDVEDRLEKAEIRFKGQVQGPESIAFDPQGRGPYTGVADGRVVFWDGKSWSGFAYTSPNRSEICDPKPSIFEYLKHEHVCGRPLGLRFHKKTGELYIADAYLGLLKVGTEGGLATPLATEAEGMPFKFTNDLDVDGEGNVYFTDTSTNYERRHFLQLTTASEPTGRLLKYDPRKKEASVLVRDLQFPNGVSLSKDESFVAFCEGSLGSRLSRHWLKGEKAGKTEVIGILPGFPDNVRTNEDGDFWEVLDEAAHPGQVPLPAQHWRQAPRHGHQVQPEGKVLQVLEDRKGKVVKIISEVEEKDGKLWIGSVIMPFIAVYDLNLSS